jgi:hypothetical protein
MSVLLVLLDPTQEIIARNLADKVWVVGAHVVLDERDYRTVGAGSSDISALAINCLGHDALLSHRGRDDQLAFADESFIRLELRKFMPNFRPGLLLAGLVEFGKHLVERPE